MSLEELLRLHRQFEKKYWDVSKDEAEYTRHVLEHLTKLLGKIGNVVEPREHGLSPSTTRIEKEVIPDLFYFALGLADKHHVNLERAYLSRLKQNETKIKDRRRGILEEPG